jgi:hypothetical protein
MTPEELFHSSGHSQDSVDLFFDELRQLTIAPSRIEQVRSVDGTILLKALP